MLDIGALPKTSASNSMDLAEIAQAEKQSASRCPPRPRDAEAAPKTQESLGRMGLPPPNA
eukprot:8690324-Pyramimonas_sp.AAC.1